MKKNLNFILLIAVIMLSMTGCADVSHIQECVQPESAYGFWGGLWHGIVSPISFIGSLFSEDIAMYALNNSGGWYDFGFALGGGILLGTARNTKN